MITRLKDGYVKEFIRFLLKNNCYQEYVFAMSETKWQNNINIAERYIQYAFDWVGYNWLLSPKGMFWHNLHSHWEFKLKLERLKKMR